MEKKRKIETSKFEKRMTRAMNEVEDFKHSTPQAKEEMKNLLRGIYSDLIRYEEPIEPYPWMRCGNE